jgi:hypothetical protein
VKRTFISLLLIMTAAVGQESNPPAPPDFSAAFKRLEALGMPPLGPAAKWSKLPDQFSGGYSDYELQQMFRTLKGNGWVVATTDGKPQLLPAGQIETTTPDGAADGAPKSTKITDADPAKDLEAIRKFLAKKKAENSRYSGSYEVNVGGKLLLLATQFHQNGKTLLANQLTAAVFDTWPNREAVVDAAVTNLADHEFEKISQNFFSSGDWAAYHASLTALQKKFPRGWPTGQAINLLLPQLAKQVAGEKPSTPTLAGVELDPRALDAVSNLTVKPKPDPAENSDEALLKRAGMKISDIPASQRAMILRSLRMHGEGGDGEFNVSPYWMLEKPDEEDKSDSLLSPLTALKIDALPVLAAILDDPYLTPFPHPNGSGYSSYFSSSEGEAERVARAYQAMPRPASRGDIAKMLLKHSVPRGEDTSDETDDETLKEQALDFWKKHRKSTREDLAIAYLQGGDRSQQSQAAEILTKSADPKHVKAFEDYVLGSESAISQYRLVQNYLSTRKAAAKPFFDSYAKAVREEAKNSSEDNNRIPYEAREKGGTEKILKNLESFVGGKSYRAIAKDIANGDPEEASAAIRSLLELMKEEPYTKKLYALLEGAVTSDKPEIRQAFVQMVFYLNEAVEEPDDEEAAADKKSKPTLRKLPEAEVKAWRKLMADQRSVKGKSEDPDARKETTIGDLAAIAVCYSASATHYGRIYQALSVIKREPEAIYLEHAEAILTGKEPPDLPDAARVKPERLRAIVEAAGAKRPLEIHPYLETLTLDERAAWSVWRHEPGDIEIPKPVKDLGTMVFRRAEENRYPYPMVTDTAPIDVGFAVSVESIKSAIGSFAKDPQKHSLTTIWLKPAAFGPGMETMAVRFSLPEKDPNDPEKMPYTASAFATAARAMENQESGDGCIVFALGAYGRGDMFEVPWITEKGKATVSEERISQTQLEEAITRVLSSDSQTEFYFSIQIVSKSDADKIRAMIPENPGDEHPFAQPIDE